MKEIRDTQQQENRRRGLKGSHIVHLSTMCHLYDGSARVAVLFFWSAQKKHKLLKGRLDLASRQVWLNYVNRFQRRSRK